MNADSTDLNSLSETVLGAVFEVSNALGAGFLEKVYQRALPRELGLRGIRATAEASFPVFYKRYSVGKYFADLFVEDRGSAPKPKVEWKRIVHCFPGAELLEAAGAYGTEE